MAVLASVIRINATVAAENTKTPNFSFLMLPIKVENMEDPAIQHTINVANTVPKGISSSGIKAFIAGVHMKTKMYMDPSNKDDTNPVYKISFDLMVVKYASTKSLYQDFLLASSLSVLCVSFP
eukprot:168331_1